MGLEELFGFIVGFLVATLIFAGTAVILDDHKQKITCKKYTKTKTEYIDCIEPKED